MLECCLLAQEQPGKRPTPMDTLCPRAGAAAPDHRHPLKGRLKTKLKLSLLLSSRKIKRPLQPFCDRGPLLMWGWGVQCTIMGIYLCNVVVWSQESSQSGHLLVCDCGPEPQFHLLNGNNRTLASLVWAEDEAGTPGSLLRYWACSRAVICNLFRS